VQFYTNCALANEIVELSKRNCAVVVENFDTRKASVSASTKCPEGWGGPAFTRNSVKAEAP